MVSETDVDQLRFDLDTARAQFEAAELELSYTTVTAPISGVIASRDVKPGNFVQIHSPIIRIVDTSQLEATLNVPERDIARLGPGQPVELIAEGALQPGMFARLRIQYDARPDALAVPRTALLEDGGEPAVYVVRDGRAQRVALTLGADEAGWVEVRAGLQAGDAVVTAGKATVRDGSLVQVLGDVVTAGKATVRDGSLVQVLGDAPTGAGNAQATHQ